eukprot:COSAG02_NODE_552_length_20429_cov_28.014068_11_plen_483_part_00
MQSNGWSATEWLGAVTAGLLYTPMHDQTAMQQNLPGLLEQVKGAVQTVAVAGDKQSPRAALLSRTPSTGGSGESEEVLALRSELDSLRQDLAKAVTYSQQQDAARDSSSTSSAVAKKQLLAPVPAEVPQLSVSIRPTSDMERLKRMLLSADSTDSKTMAVTSEKSKLSAMGMGGIGKTVTAAWLARDADIRAHFEAVICKSQSCCQQAPDSGSCRSTHAFVLSCSIAGVTLGQTPAMDRMRALIYLQASGEELSSETSPEQAKELITTQLRGRTVLVIIDDVWEPSHEAALNFIDTSTASRTLVTTRIRGLGGTEQVELGVPSEEESVKLLMAAAGLAHLKPVPTEAQEVVKLCGRLPLALDIAGSMLRDLGVSGEDWTGIPRLLQQEMQSSAGGDETTLEYRILAASLQAVPLRDREDCRKVFSVFALVAEDTYVPLSAFQIILSAVTGEAELVPQLQLRKWLQILINRSIVLGSWERPSL